jgi:hypothetical protein
MPNGSINRVTVTDVDMPFLSMVRFMVKWAIAAIPALLILTILTAVFWSVLLGFLAGLGSTFSPKSSERSSSGSSGSAPSSAALDPGVVAYCSQALAVDWNHLDRDRKREWGHTTFQKLFSLRNPGSRN